MRTYQIRLPINGSRNQRPQIVVIGGSMPFLRYICSTSPAIRNIVTGEINKVMKR